MGLGLAPETYANGSYPQRGDHELSYLRKRSKIENGDTELLRLTTTGNEGFVSSISHTNYKTPSLEDDSRRMEIRRDVHFQVSYEDVQDKALH